MGGRSRAAVQLLNAKGFKTYNLKGGIKSWKDPSAQGPEDMGLFLIKGDETPSEIIILSYGLEEGLRRLYSELAKDSKDQTLLKLFNKLAGIEEKHKKKLFSLYLSAEKSQVDQETFENKIVLDFMEGGFTVKEFLEKYQPVMKTENDVINVAMMLEAQALDLYVRYAEKSREQAVKDVLLGLADEEKSHLNSLANLLDKKTGK
ncbi:Rhodanese-like and rubrerythrin domains-containing protein [Desulfonema limicola]|uniref:Rhodanese-like and rubrerythrin domains-containing protein n=1 Tax=Desulfonema limicola TaxID=45656 RepID=A0A975BDD4_9BACT|nr:ferritin family protein [Desulfonema limicola]QTA83282.1 Rhodanese-like and rubrerythrin domains-containing protein [Desulfonema limicola]